MIFSTPESPWDSKEIKPINLKGNQPWVLVGMTDTKVETLVFWSSDANSWVSGKFPEAGDDWGQKKRTSEDEMAGWHHWCNEHEIGQTSGAGEGQGGLACCSPWGRKELDMTGRLNNNKGEEGWRTFYLFPSLRMHRHRGIFVSSINLWLSPYLFLRKKLIEYLIFLTYLKN